MAKNRFKKNWLWNLINFKNFSNWPIGSIFTGIVLTYCAVYKVWRWRSQVFTSHKLMRENTNWFFVFQDSSISDVQGRDMSMYLKSSYSLHSILASVLCKKWSNIDWNSMPRGSGCGYINSSISVLCQFPWDHVVWFSQSHNTQTRWQRPFTWYGLANCSGCGYATGCARNVCTCTVDSCLPQIDWFTFFQHIRPNMK